MIEVAKNLFVGSQEDWENIVSNEENWVVIHACKEPHHRRLLGYTTPGAPKDHPEYLMAKRGNSLYLNLIDAPKSEFIPKEIIDAAVALIDTSLATNKKVFIHCNQGESRAPSIALMFLFKTGELNGTPQEVIDKFTEIYPSYMPSQGMLDYTIRYIEGR